MSHYFSKANQAEYVEGCTLSDIPELVLNSSKPLILRGLVSAWPLVNTAKRSVQEAVDYIRMFYKGAELGAFIGDKYQGGRYFYNDSFTGFNFVKQRASLEPLFETLARPSDSNENRYIYVGSANVDHVFPGFKDENDLPALHKYTPLTNIWFGNQSRIAAHQDNPQNLACCVAGKRRFTLFPPEQIGNLYIGPLDFTPAGQAVSLVDFHQPDLQRFPKFKHAEAVVAELEPGDALIVPSLWWHHVEGLSDFNVLVNYWWSSSPNYAAAPMDALLHSLLAIKHLSKEQKQAWKSIYEHYLFNNDDSAFTYLPEEHQGLLTKEDELYARQLRQYLLNKLNR